MREPCPPPATLERFALHGEGASGLAGHVDRCPACREYVEDARENEAFLGRAAPALAEARPAPREPIDPHAVDGFELVEEISRGGQGVVYRAVQAATHRPAAVKMLLAGAFASDRQRRRFEREVEIAARLRHPNVVTVFESGQTPDGRPFVAMEFVNGVPIDRYVRDRLPEPGRDRTDAVLRLFLAIASGVAAAHAAGVIHRDLKPSNVLVDADGVPRVLDFGLARPITDHPEATVTHEFAGTPAYAAPEQFIGDAAAIGTATDVYALGVMLYTALTGRHPYPRDGSLAELAQHAASTDPAPPSRYVRRLPSDVETIVLKSLAKDPARRYRSAGSMAADIGDYLSGLPISARRDSAAYVLHRLAKRHRGTAAAALVVLLTIVGAVVGLALLASDLDLERRAALEALRDSRIHRARLMAAAGELDQAEELLWREAVVAGVRAHDSNFGFEHDAMQRRASWALVEYYTRVPRAMRVRLGAPADRVEVAADGTEIGARDVHGASARWSRDGRLLHATPPLRTLPPSVQRTQQYSEDYDRHVRYADGTLRIVDPRSGATLAGPVAIEPPPRQFWMTADGNHVVVWDADRSVRVLDGHTLGERGVLLGPEAMAFNMRLFDEHGMLAVVCVASPAACVRSWRLDTLRESPFRATDPSAPTGLDAASNSFNTLSTPAVSPDAMWHAAGSGGAVLVWHADHPDRPALLDGHAASIAHLTFSANASRLVSVSTDGVTCVWSLPAGNLLHRWANGSRALATDIRTDLGLLVVGDVRGFVTLYELRDRPWLHTVSAPPMGIMALAVSPDGRTYAWGGQAGSIAVYDADSKRAMHDIDAHDALISAICFSPDGGTLYSGSVDGAVRAWNPATGTLERTIFEGLPAVWALSASPDGRSLAAGGLGGFVCAWDTTTWEARPFLGIESIRVPNLAFSPDGSLLAAVSAHPDVQPCVWNARTGDLLFRLQGHTREVRALAFSPDGNTIATGSDDLTIRLWDAHTGALLRTITGLARDPFELAFDLTGRILYCVGRGPALGVYDPTAGIELASITVHERLVFGLALSPDGRTLITGGEDDRIAFWDLDHLFSYVRGNAARWEAQLAGEGSENGPRSVGTRRGPGK
ncbi:MAG: hypothetical protein DYG93_09350 [Leptolyngbya sp. PLA2]|nr:hypothetical protein [Leptolyngbya sp.]MCE7971852.1 hypothetical protein [Leptolyngbya sp. PL-A2]MCZ7634493.1 protein kinase [Phycisphaerales bacterium]GIK19809.1 MAG: hypothetical protein BroJett004_19730 [Planctomycetota bacterium]